MVEYRVCDVYLAGKDVDMGDTNRNSSGGGIGDDEKHLAVLTGEAEV